MSIVAFDLTSNDLLTDLIVICDHS